MWRYAESYVVTVIACTSHRRRPRSSPSSDTMNRYRGRQLNAWTDLGELVIQRSSYGSTVPPHGRLSGVRRALRTPRGRRAALYSAGRQSGEPSDLLVARNGEQSSSFDDIAAWAFLRNMTFVIFAPRTFFAAMS